MPAQVEEAGDGDLTALEGDPTFIGSAASTVGSLQGQFRSVMEQRQREEERSLENILGAMSKQFVDIEGYQGHHSNAVSAMLQAQGAGGGGGGGNAAAGGGAEPAFVQERATEYGKRLQKAAHAIYLKHSAQLHAEGGRYADVMADLKKEELEKVLYGQVISDSDAMLISEVAARAQEALIDYKIELMDDVMVNLDTNPHEDNPDGGQSCNDPNCQATHTRQPPPAAAAAALDEQR